MNTPPPQRLGPQISHENVSCWAVSYWNRSYWNRSYWNVRVGIVLFVLGLVACDSGAASSPTPDITLDAGASTPSPTPPVPTATPEAEVSTPGVPAFQLEPNGWFAPNVLSLDTFLSEQAAADPRSGALLVMGWDDSLLYGSLTEAAFRYQLQTLNFKITPEVLEQVLPEVAGSTWDALGTVDQVEGVSLEALRADILDAYRVLYPAYAPTGGCSSACESLETLQSTEAYKSLFAKFLFLVQGLSAHPDVGLQTTSVLMTRLYAGMTETEARQLVLSAYAYERGMAIQRLSYQSPASGQSGVVSGSYRVGLRAYQELSDVLTAARKAGLDAWVVASAPQWAIQAAIGAQTGYDIEETNVIGIQLERVRTDTTQVYSSLPSAELPIPYGEGKLEAIDVRIGKPPSLIVGGKHEDLVLIEQAGGLALTLVINRMESCPFSDLYLDADATGSAEAGTLLLQGIDNEAGAFWPEQGNLPFGGGSVEPLPPACG